MTTIWFRCFRTPARLLLTSVFVVILCNRTLAQSRITPDNSLGAERSRIVRRAGKPNVDRIQGGARRGKLLFHSFDDFNVEQGGEATFANPKGVSNIFTRVTGSLETNILGTLGVDGNANLFLLNPNGIYFGPQAKLNIEGSFFASTALALELGDGATFRADASEVPNLLTLRVPVGVQFGESPGDIISEGLLQSGRDFTLAGDHLIVSGELSSGRNLVLRSLNPIQSKARFLAGRNFKVEDVDGNFGKLMSPDGQMILADGNVALGDYEGGSLHILAGGLVRLGEVLIEDSGSVEATINPNNQDKINRKLTFADLASFEMPDFELQNTDGRLRQVPIRRAIAIDGSKQATLDARAGVNWEKLGGVLKPSKVSGDLSLPETEARTSRIAVGRARIDQPEGNVFLTNRFRPDRELKAGEIVTQKIDTSVEEIEQDAGDVSILGFGDIVNSFIDASSTSSYSNSGNGGEISVASHTGNIKNNNLSSFSNSYEATAGNGGTISIASRSGSINNRDLRSDSFSYRGDAKNGGAILVTSRSGNINNRDLSSSSKSYRGGAGNGGAISVYSHSGNISNIDLSSYSDSLLGNGNGGAISVASRSGNINNRDLSSASFSFYGDAENGGAISVASRSGNINNRDFNASSGTVYRFAGNGGAISIASRSGNINNRDFNTSSYSTYGYAENGGAISVTSRSGNINNRDLSSSSNALYYNAGNGGAISVTSRSGNINNRDLNSSSIVPKGKYDISGDAGNGGAILVTSRSGDIHFTGPVSTFSYARSGNSRNAGSIVVRSSQGSIQGVRENNTKTKFLAFSLGKTESRKGGNILLKSNSIRNLELQTQSSSNISGDVTIKSASKSLLVQDLDLITGATVEIQDPFNPYSPITIDATQIESSGNVTITSSVNTRLERVNIDSDSNGNNPAGDIFIRTPASLLLKNSAISTNANSIGRAGNLNVVAENIFLNKSAISASTQAIGTGGNINLKLKQLTFSEGSTITTSTAGSGKGGDIKITSGDKLAIGGKGRITSESLEEGGPAGSLSLERITNSNQPIPLESLIIRDGVQLSVNTESSSEAGDLNVKAKNVVVNGATLSASTSSSGQGGNLNLNLERLTFFNDGTIIASTNGTGKGGDISVNTPKNLTIQGDGRISSEAIEQGSIAGNLTIQGTTSRDQPRQLETLIIKDGTELSVNSEVTAGSLDINSNTILLDDAKLTAQIRGGEGQARQGDENIDSNINIDFGDFLILQNNSQISAEASNQATGGNISISSPSGFLIGLPSRGNGNDIIATAQAGQGGNITITPKGIFGFTETDDFPEDNNHLNDINASSRTNLQGTVNVNSVDIDPNDNKPPLPESFSPPLVQNTCHPGGKHSFTDIRKGGMAPDLEETTINIWDDTRYTLSSDLSETKAKNPPQPAPPPITEAQGWIKNSEGTIQLITPNTTLLAIAHQPNACKTTLKP